MVAAALVTAVSVHAEFVLHGEYWTNITAQGTNTGILVVPPGPGPFPGVVISHGKGGTARGFALPKAQVMQTWGFACIGPDYTHAYGSTITNQDGASPENIRRGAESIELLAAYANADTNRIAVYGNSMGAFVAIGLAAELTQTVRAAAITAGGIVPSGLASSPTTTTAARVRSPFLILHGTADTTVPPERSELLKSILDEHNVTNSRVLFDDVGHSLHVDRSNQVYALMRDWFTAFGVLSPPLPLTATVSNLTALYHDGQTFLTWTRPPDPALGFRIYAATTPLTNAAVLASATFLGSARSDSAHNVRLSDIRGTNFYFSIASTTPPLSEDKGLFVCTITNDAARYYAVTVTSGTNENLALLPGQNTLMAPVSESVGLPVPVWQTNIVVGPRTYEIYTHWTGPYGHAQYPTMTTASCFPFNFALIRQGSAPLHSLLVRLHARWGNFFGSASSGDPNEWVLSPDDHLPNDIGNTFWYGYHEGFDFYTGEGTPTNGIVNDYTVRRVRWLLDWATRTLPVDTNRIYMTGGSMGGIGSCFLSIMLPGRVAAIFTTVPKFDFSFTNDPNMINIWNDYRPERTMGERLWGRLEDNLPCSDGMPVYDRLNAGALARRFRAQSFPVMYAFNGKYDVVVGWAEKIGFYATMQTNRHGGFWFFDSRLHNGANAEWFPAQNRQLLNKYRLDQSYPAISFCTADDDPGNGLTNSGDVFGTLNGHVDWDTNIADEIAHYEVRLQLVPLASTVGTITPPSNATADVTLRRLQHFVVSPGNDYAWHVLNATGATIQSGMAVGDEDGLLTVPGVALTPQGTRLVVDVPEPELVCIAMLVAIRVSVHVHSAAVHVRVHG